MHLPKFYPLDTKTTIVDGKEKTDTVYHTIPSFKFVNQGGDTISEQHFDKKIFVADFFFTTCPTICPKMSGQMKRIQNAYKKRDDFLIISHSVNPEHDSVSVLAEYAKLYGGISGKWHFVTGKRNDIYTLGVEGYKLAVDEDPRAPGGFLHSEMFVLVDKEKVIRGYYDGTDSVQVDKLIEAIKLLAADYIATKTNTTIIQKH